MINPPAVIDTNVFSNFALTGNIAILKELYSPLLYMPTIVIQECMGKCTLFPYIKKALNDNWIKEYIISFSQTPKEFEEHTKIRKRFHEGESEVLAIAKVNRYIVISDDMSGVKTYCKRNNLVLKGSLGIIYEAFDKKIISYEQGNKILQDMIQFNNYRSPVNTMEEIIDWFLYKKGKELY